MSTALGRVLRLGGAIVAAFLVGRAVVELAMVDPGRPASYRNDWGGPTYIGVVLVHAGPGLLVLVLAVVWLWRRSVRRRHRST